MSEGDQLTQVSNAEDRPLRSSNLNRQLREVVLIPEVFDSLLSYARMNHPREGILLLRGRAKKESVLIMEVLIPPFATKGRGFSGFPLHSLPIDFSVMGVAHSHPSGILRPSTGDLNWMYGRVMIIIAYPYKSLADLAAFDREGRRIDVVVSRQA